MRVYACIYGWLQFVTTDPNHWCIIKGDGIIIPFKDEDWIQYPQGNLKIIHNATDVPSCLEVNMYGFKLKTP